MRDVCVSFFCHRILALSVHELVPVYLTSSFPLPPLHHNILKPSRYSPLFSPFLFSPLFSSPLLSSPHHPHLTSPLLFPLSSYLLSSNSLSSAFYLFHSLQLTSPHLTSPHHPHLFSSPLYNYKIYFYSMALRSIRPVQIPAQSCLYPVLLIILLDDNLD